MFCQLVREFESCPVHFLILFQNFENLSSKIGVSSNLIWAQKTSYPTISAHSGRGAWGIFSCLIHYQVRHKYWFQSAVVSTLPEKDVNHSLFQSWIEEIDVNHSLFQNWMDSITNSFVDANEVVTKSSLLLTAFKCIQLWNKVWFT